MGPVCFSWHSLIYVPFLMRRSRVKLCCGEMTLGANSLHLEWDGRCEAASKRCHACFRGLRMHLDRRWLKRFCFWSIYQRKKMRSD